uniref:Uncharacterized protein n=1 Tax=Meloidogyne incognita TaxID=6306 RepID=A0A914L2Z8_MELIC
MEEVAEIRNWTYCLFNSSPSFTGNITSTLVANHLLPQSSQLMVIGTPSSTAIGFC